MTTANTFVLGKVKELDILHVVRHIKTSLGRSEFLENQPESVNTYEWISGDEWNRKRNVLEGSIVENLMKTDGLTIDEAKRVFESCFLLYLSIYFAEMSASDGLRSVYERYYIRRLFSNSVDKFDIRLI